MSLTSKQRAAWFVQACEILFGHLWQTVGSSRLGISRRTIIRYAVEDSPVPEEVLNKVGKMLLKRSDESSKFANIWFNGR